MAEIRRATCPECGKSFKANHGLRKFCTDLCRSRNRESRLRGAKTAGPRQVTCLECGESFEAAHKLRQFCSEQCRYRNRDSRPHRREYDNRRHRESYASDPQAYNASHPRRPKARAAMYGADYEPIDPQQVFERDGWMCGICAEPVDQSLVYPDPMSASLDHIVPWTAGGHHLMTNVQCSHLTCNFRKGSKILEGASGSTP